MMSTAKSISGRDRDQRRLIERLSGWRLVAFFVVLSMNLASLTFMSFFVLVPNPRWQAAFIGLASSQSALFAIAIGAFRFRIRLKLMFLVAHFVACLWAIRQFTMKGFFDPLIVDAFFLLGTQSLLICGVACFSGKKSFAFGSLARRLEFRIRDLLIITAAVGVLIPALQFFLPNWSAIWRTRPTDIAIACGKGLLNALWCITLLSCFVRGILPAKYGSRNWIFRLWQIALLLMVALFLEASFKLMNVESLTAWSRFSFASWLSMSLIPVAGLATETCQPKWVTMSEFYRKVQKRADDLRRKPTMASAADGKAYPPTVLDIRR